jgi:hypothetical protein
MKYHDPEVLQQPQLDSRDLEMMKMLLDIYLTGIRQNRAEHKYFTSQNLHSTQTPPSTKL